MLVLFYLVTVVVILSGYMLGRIMVTLVVDNCLAEASVGQLLVL